MKRWTDKELEQAYRDGLRTERKRVLRLLENTFTEGWWSYFNVTYGLDDMKINEEMMADIDRKITQLKEGITPTVQEASK